MMDNAKLIAEAWEANKAEVDNADGFISLYARLAVGLEQADARILELEQNLSGNYPGLCGKCVTNAVNAKSCYVCENDRLSARIEKLEAELVDCPACSGMGYHDDDKICLCTCEYSHGYTPGKLPLERAARYVRDKMVAIRGFKARIETLESEAKDHDTALDRWWKILMRADSLWQKEHNEPHTMPDGTELVNWMVGTIHKLRSRIAELEKAILAATDMLPLCPGCLHHKEAGHASGCIVETIKKGDTQ